VKTARWRDDGGAASSYGGGHGSNDWSQRGE